MMLFELMTIIDAHAHLPGDDPSAVRLLDALDVRVVNISIGCDAHGAWRGVTRYGAEPFATLARQEPKRFAWCTSIDLPRYDDPHYVERVIEQLDKDFAKGAMACKIWKNIGMEAKDPAGRFAMVDDPLFEPIFRHLAREGRTAILHTGEPKACWMPLDPKSPHYDYYRTHPGWHMHGRTDFPSHEQLIAARDRVLEKHPGLRMVGAHLGSLEWDVAEVALRLDRFPNFAVDTGERLLDLALQDRDKVRAFFARYPDRVLFGTDIDLESPLSQMDEPSRRRTVDTMRQRYESELSFYRDPADVAFKGRVVRGLGLDAAVQPRFFHDNAVRWFGAAL
jgi:predicted TIM-barrel fold metal-dependent hydrolase